METRKDKCDASGTPPELQTVVGEGYEIEIKHETEE